MQQSFTWGLQLCLLHCLKPNINVHIFLVFISFERPERAQLVYQEDKASSVSKLIYWGQSICTWLSWISCTLATSMKQWQLATKSWYLTKLTFDKDNRSISCFRKWVCRSRLLKMLHRMFCETDNRRTNVGSLFSICRQKGSVYQSLFVLNFGCF